MDESTLLKAFGRLRSGEGLSLIGMRAEPALIAYLGCSDAESALKRLSHLAGNIDHESSRLAVLAELGIGFTGHNIGARRDALIAHYEAREVIRGVERIRQHSRTGFKELAAVVANLHESTVSKKNLQYWPPRVSNNSFIIKTEFGSRVVLGTLDEEGDLETGKLSFSLERKEDSAWLVTGEYMKNILIVDIFEADLSILASPVKFRHQTGYLFSAGPESPLTEDLAIVDIEIKLARSSDANADNLYYAQLSDKQSGWQRSSITPLADEKATSIVMMLADCGDTSSALFASSQTKLIQCHSNEAIYGPGSFMSEMKTVVTNAINKAKAETQRKLEALDAEPSTESQSVQE